MFGTMVAMYVWAKRERAFYYILHTMTAIFVISLFKLAYHLPRPYMVNEGIEVYGCSTEYGDPSGHTFSSSAILTTLLLDFYAKYKDNKFSIKLLGFVIVFVLIMIVGFSRLYNGDHTLDQIIYGILLGLWLAMFMHFTIRDQVFDHIQILMSKRKP